MTPRHLLVLCDLPRPESVTLIVPESAIAPSGCGVGGSNAFVISHPRVRNLFSLSRLSDSRSLVEVGVAMVVLDTNLKKGLSRNEQPFSSPQVDKPFFYANPSILVRKRWTLVMMDSNLENGLSVTRPPSIESGITRHVVPCTHTFGRDCQHLVTCAHSERHTCGDDVSTPSPAHTPTLEATQAQIDGFLSQIPYKRHQNRVSSVGG